MTIKYHNVIPALLSLTYVMLLIWRPIFIPPENTLWVYLAIELAALSLLIAKLLQTRTRLWLVILIGFLLISSVLLVVAFLSDALPIPIECYQDTLSQSEIRYTCVTSARWFSYICNDSTMHPGPVDQICPIRCTVYEGDASRIFANVVDVGDCDLYVNIHGDTLDLQFPSTR